MADHRAEGDVFFHVSRSRLGKYVRRQFDIRENGQWLIGEEAMKRSRLSADFGTREHPIVLVDALDGTRLWQRDLSNWCVAVVIFVPRTAVVLGAFVCDALGRVYFSLGPEDNDAYRILPDTPENLKKCKRYGLRNQSQKEEVTLAEAHICFVGSKIEQFRLFWERVGQRLPGFQGRIFNLGGIPMLAKLADGTVDAVVELKGQVAHDVVAGLHIALRAGATVIDLDTRRQLDQRTEVFQALLRDPQKAQLRYVAARNTRLAADLAALM